MTYGLKISKISWVDLNQLHIRNPTKIEFLKPNRVGKSVQWKLIYFTIEEARGEELPKLREETGLMPSILHPGNKFPFFLPDSGL